MPCCEEDVKKQESSQVVREVTDMLESVFRKIRWLDGIAVQEENILKLFKYLGTVTDLVACGTKLATLKMLIAQKKDAAETEEEKQEDMVIQQAIDTIYS